jgi:predicted amino acid dehydrogenase
MKRIVSISLGRHEQDFKLKLEFLGRPMSIARLGADGDPIRAGELLSHWEGRCDAIGIGLAKESDVVGAERYTSSATQALLRQPRLVPVTTGGRLGDILQEWAVRHVQVSLGHYFNNANVLFFSGRSSFKLAQTMSEYTPNLMFADPLLDLGVPKLLTSLGALERYSRGAHYVTQWTPQGALKTPALEQWRHFILRKALQKATVVVAPVHLLDEFGLEELAGKTIVTATVNDERIAAFAAKGVQMVVDAAPMLQQHVIGPDLLDAMIVAALDKAPEDLLEDDYLEILAGLGQEPRIVYPCGFRRVNRFAFVIHPLSQEYFKKIRPIDMLSQVSPPLFMNSLEKAMAYAPPFVYSRVTGIVSPTGVEAEGWLISVGGTPREIMRHSPEFTYRRLLAAAAMAKRLGAQIMGLGAFTKVVGDAGLTVAKRAPLPITTGNSYSASGALWAAHDAMLRLGLIQIDHDGSKVPFKAMVVGATGAIGSVCARLLAKVAREVYLVSPETAKLLALKESILLETPDAHVFLSARADKDIAAMDMIVTATSGAGKKVLDIMQVKPGCVITDVARPLDLPPSEVAKRPDVLVIESGEILLPGEVSMKSIGLPPNVAYACLAETIVLALEGRFENFTVGRNIEWEKVREIYKMGIKHGMRLAAISGVNGVYSDDDIAKVRTLALAARANVGRRAPPSLPQVGAGDTAVPPVRATVRAPAVGRQTSR